MTRNPTAQFIRQPLDLTGGLDGFKLWLGREVVATYPTSDEAWAAYLEAAETGSLLRATLAKKPA